MRWLIGHPWNLSSPCMTSMRGWTEALAASANRNWTFNLDRRLQFFDAAHLNDDGAADDEAHLLIDKALTRPAAMQMATYEILKPAFCSAWPDVVPPISGFWYYTLHDAPRMKLALYRRRRTRRINAAHPKPPMLTTWSAHLTGIELYREFGPAEYMHSYRPHIHHPATGSGRSTVVHRVRDFPAGSSFSSRWT